MATDGPTAPGTLVSDNTIGAVAWTNPTNAGASNNSYATAFTIGARSSPEGYLDGTFSLGMLAAAFAPDRMVDTYYNLTAPLFGVTS